MFPGLIENVYIGYTSVVVYGGKLRSIIYFIIRDFEKKVGLTNRHILTDWLIDRDLLFKKV